MDFPLSVKFKIRLSLWLVTLVLVAIGGATATIWFRREQSTRLDDFLEREGQTVKELLEGYFSFNGGEGPTYDSLTNRDFLEFVSHYFQERNNKPLPYKTTLGIFTLQGNAVAVTNEALDLSVPEPAEALGTKLVSVTKPQDYRLVVLPIVHAGQVLGTVRMACLTLALDENFSSFLVSLFSVLGVAFLGFGGLGTILIGWSLKPVRRMSTSATEISESQLDHRLVVPPGSDELSHLAETLNKLIARLEREFKFEEALVGQLSHELRTPLTILRARNEVALERYSSEAEYRSAFEDNLADIDRLVSLLNTMLNLARLDSGFERPELKPCDLRQLLRELVEDLGPLWEEKDLGFHYSLPDQKTSWILCPPVIALCDRFLLRQVFLNILTNSFKYAPRASRIYLSIEPDGTVEKPTWKIVFRNSGPPIPEDSLELIFKRFYRVVSQDPETTEQSSGLGQKGFGLGLSLAQAMLNLQDGCIRAFNPPQGGAAFEINIQRISSSKITRNERSFK